MMKRPWPRDPEVVLDVKDIGASRAMFVDEDTQLVRVEVITTDNQRIIFEMPSRLAGKLIEGALQAYNAIHPPLKTTRGGWGL